MKLLVLFVICSLCSAECISHIKQAETEVFEMNIPEGIKRASSDALEKKPFKVYFDTSALEEEVVSKGLSQSSKPVCFKKESGAGCDNDANLLTKEKKQYIINKIIPEVKRNMELFFNVHKITVTDLYDYLHNETFYGKETRTEEYKGDVAEYQGKKFYKCGEVKVIDPSSYIERIK